MFNSNNSLSNNQAFFKEFISILYWMEGSLIGYANYEPLSIPHVFTKDRKKILSIIIQYSGIYQNLYISQQRIADLAGCHRETVIEALKIFHDLGIIKKQYRGANRTCMYSLGSFFHNERVQWALKDIFPNLYWCIQSTVRRCKNLLKGLVSMIYKPIPTRLSNDKNKSINTIKKDKFIHTKTEKKELEIPKVYEPDPDHDKFFNEFAAILNITI